MRVKWLWLGNGWPSGAKIAERSPFTDCHAAFTENRKTGWMKTGMVSLSQPNEDLQMHFRSCQNTVMARHDTNPARHLLWGVALVALGVIFLMDRLAWIDLTQYLGPQTHWWHFLPLLLALGGLIRMLTAQSVRQLAKGLVRIVVGLWLFACLQQLGGLSFANSWPVLLVAFGAQMLVRGWYGRGTRPCEEVAP